MQCYHDDIHVTGYLDSYYSGCPDILSTLSYAFMLVDGAISWKVLNKPLVVFQPCKQTL